MEPLFIDPQRDKQRSRFWAWWLRKSLGKQAAIIIAAAVSVFLFIGIIGDATSGSTSGNASSTSGGSAASSQATSQPSGTMTIWDWSQMDYNQQIKVIVSELHQWNKPVNSATKRDLYSAVFQENSNGGSSWTVDQGVGNAFASCLLSNCTFGGQPYQIT
jgi:hypothetical protein